MPLLDKTALKNDVPVMLSRHPARYNPLTYQTRGVYIERDLIERCQEKGVSVAKVFSTLGNQALREYLESIEKEG